MLSTISPGRAPAWSLVFLVIAAACQPNAVESPYDPSPKGNGLSALSAYPPDAGPPRTECAGDADCTPGPAPDCTPDWPCPGDDGGTVETEVTSMVFGARGLYTSPSFLTAAPPGSALVANNVVVDVPGEYSTRRGFERLPAALPGGVPVSSWTTYDGAIIAYSSTTATLYRYVAGTWTAFAGLYVPPDEGDVAGKVSFFETQQALYFTTAAGVYRLEGLTEAPVLAGVIQALPAVVSIPSAGQALSASASTAYRYVWGRRATNGRLMLGAPSGRVTITNRNEAGTFTPSAMSKSALGVVTVTATSTQVAQLLVGQVVNLTAVDAPDAAAFPLGSYTITSIPTATTFTYQGAGGPATAATPSAASYTSVATSVSVTNTIPIPSGVDDTYFLQVYRADEVPLNVSPSDEMYLVHERAVSDMVDGATSYSFTDITPDDLKGDALYTNANANGGIGSALFAPPLAATATIFGDRAFYGDVALPERLALTVLAAGTDGLAVGMRFRIGFPGTTVGSTTYTAGATEAGTTFKVFTAGSPSQNVADTVQSFVRVINATVGGRVYARYISDSDINPGQFIIESRSISSAPLVFLPLQNSPFITPTLPYEVQVGIMTRAANLTTVDVSGGRPHGFIVGQVVRRSAGTDPNFPTGLFTVTTVVDADTFVISDPGVNAVAAASFQFVSSGVPVLTDDEDSPGGWMVSAEANPDGVPASIPEIAGDRYKRILRFLVLDSSLFMLKEDGLFRLTGTAPENYVVECVDNTVRFVAPRAAVVIGSRAYALTTQGLMSWTESTKPEPASVPVESTFRNLIETSRAAVESSAFAVAHDSKRRAYFWLPSGPDDVSATQVLIFNTLTQTWTRWDKAAVTALVNDSDRLVIAPPEVDGIAPAPAQERNTGTLADYQDEAGEAIIAQITWTPHVAPDPDAEKQLVWTTWRFAGPVPSTVDVAFQTPWSPTPIWFPLTSEDSQEPGTVSTPPTMEHSRGKSHTISIRHAQVGVPLRMLGYSARVRTYADRP